MTTASSAELVAEARRGNRPAMDALVRLTYAETYTLAFRLTGNEDDARDVAQEAYLRAWRGMRRFRGDARFSTWMYRITANCAASALARRARTRTEVLDDEAAIVDVRPGSDPEGRATSTHDRRALTVAVGALPVGLREVLVLRDIYDLPHRAIAEHLGITEAAAKVRLHRARRRLLADLTSAGVGSSASWSGEPEAERAS